MESYKIHPEFPVLHLISSFCSQYPSVLSSERNVWCLATHESETNLLTLKDMGFHHESGYRSNFWKPAHPYKPDCWFKRSLRYGRFTALDCISHAFWLPVCGCPTKNCYKFLHLWKFCQFLSSKHLVATNIWKLRLTYHSDKLVANFLLSKNRLGFWLFLSTQSY